MKHVLAIALTSTLACCLAGCPDENKAETANAAPPVPSPSTAVTAAATPSTPVVPAPTAALTATPSPADAGAGDARAPVDAGAKRR